MAKYIPLEFKKGVRNLTQMLLCSSCGFWDFWGRGPYCYQRNCCEVLPGSLFVFFREIQRRI